MCAVFPIHPQAARDVAQETKKAWLEPLREMQSRDTLPPVAVFGAPSRKDGVSLLAGRSFAALHLRVKELSNAINGEQPFAARLAAPSQADTFNFAVA